MGLEAFMNSRSSISSWAVYFLLFVKKIVKCVWFLKTPWGAHKNISVNVKNIQPIPIFKKKILFKDIDCSLVKLSGLHYINSGFFVFHVSLTGVGLSMLYIDFRPVS
jgi:hypothetical protein